MTTKELAATSKPEPKGAAAPAPAPTPDPDAAHRAFKFDSATMSCTPEGKVYAFAEGVDDKSPEKKSVLMHTYPSRTWAEDRGLVPKTATFLRHVPDKPKQPQQASLLTSDPPEKKSEVSLSTPSHEVPAVVDPLLVNILSWPREHGTVTELAFTRWLREYIGQLGQVALVMAEGCVFVDVKPQLGANEKGEVIYGKSSTTLFSCHVDTIERGTGHKDASVDEATGAITFTRKKLNYDATMGIIGLEKDSIGGSLGADDGAGVWLMLKMIEAKVPGAYVFHRGEEVGGKGSEAMADKFKDTLSKYECAVAFDRADEYEVIWMQGGVRCASDKFTEALCKRLTDKGMSYQPSSRGTFTDTKNYRHLIAECVNVGVGYCSQHGRDELLDFSHLNALLDACCKIDWDSLPIDRDPKKYEAPQYGGGYSGGRSYGQGGYGRSGSYGQGGYGRSGSYGRSGDWNRGDSDNDAWDFPKGNPPSGGKKLGKKARKALANAPKVNLTVSELLSTCTLLELEAWVEDDPAGAAETVGQLLLEINQLKASNKTLMTMMGWDDAIPGDDMH